MRPQQNITSTHQQTSERILKSEASSIKEHHRQVTGASNWLLVLIVVSVTALGGITLTRGGSIAFESFFGTLRIEKPLQSGSPSKTD